MNFTRSTSDTISGFQATLVNVGYGQIMLRDQRGKVAQKWAISQPKCIIGSNPGCTVQCKLPGIAEQHVLIVIGAKQVFMRSLAPRVERDGMAVSELVVPCPQGEFKFNVAGHSFEYVRNVEHLKSPPPAAVQTSTNADWNKSGVPAQPTSAPSERFKFTFVRALEKKRPNLPENSYLQQPTTPAQATVVAQPPVTAQLTVQTPLAAQTQSFAPVVPGHTLESWNERPDWVNDVLRKALRPMEMRLDELVQPVEELKRQIRRQNARMRKQDEAEQIRRQDGPAAIDPHTRELLDSQEKIQRIVVDQSARIEQVNKRVADIVGQLSILERIVATESEQNSHSANRTTQSGKEILRLQREMMVQVNSLQNKLVEPLPTAIDPEELRWRDAIERQLSEFNQTLGLLEEIKAGLEPVVGSDADDIAWQQSVQRQLDELHQSPRAIDELKLGLEPVINRPDIDAEELRWRDAIERQLSEFSQALGLLEEIKGRLEPVIDPENAAWQQSVQRQLDDLRQSLRAIDELKLGLAPVINHAADEADAEATRLADAQRADSQWRAEVQGQLIDLHRAIVSLEEIKSSVVLASQADEFEAAESQWRNAVQTQLQELQQSLGSLEEIRSRLEQASQATELEVAESQWRSTVQSQLTELRQSLHGLDEIKVQVELAVQRNDDLVGQWESRWQSIEEAMSRPLLSREAGISNPMQSNRSEVDYPNEASILAEPVPLPAWWSDDPTDQRSPDASPFEYAEPKVSKEFFPNSFESDSQHPVQYSRPDDQYASSAFSADELAIPEQVSPESDSYARPKQDSEFYSKYTPQSPLVSHSEEDQSRRIEPELESHRNAGFAAEPQYAEPQYAEPQYAEPQYDPQPSQYLEHSYDAPRFAESRYHDSPEDLLRKGELPFEGAQEEEPTYKEPTYTEPEHETSRFSESLLDIADRPTNSYLAERFPLADENPLAQYDVEPAADMYSQLNENPAENTQSYLNSSQQDAATPTSPATADDGDESVEDYMRRLLARMRGVSESEVQLPVLDGQASNKLQSKNPQSNHSQRKSDKGNSSVGSISSVATVGGVSDTQPADRISEDWTEPFDPSSYVPRGAAPEKNKDIHALRELANTSARSAIQVSTRRRHGSAVVIKLSVALVGLVAGVALVSINGVRVNVALIATIASFLVAGIWGYDAVTTFQALVAANRHSKSQAARAVKAELANKSDV